MSSATKSKFSNITSKLKTIALIMLVVFGVAPILLAAIPGTSSNVSFSIYNDDYDGLSEIRRDLEGQKLSSGIDKYNVTNIISNLNVLNRFNGSGALVIAAPSSDFSITETVSIILFMLRGGSVIVADDFGSSNQILDPIFDLFQNCDKITGQIGNLGESGGFDAVPIPSCSEIMNNFAGGGGEDGGDTGDGDNGDSTTTGDIEDQYRDFIGGEGSAEETVSPDDFMSELIGDLIVRFGFNSSGILMDAQNNQGHPARVIIEDFDDNQLEGYTFTQNVERVAMEFGTIISVQLKVPQRDENGDPVVENGVQQNRTVWQPLGKLTGSDVGNQFGEDFELSLPLFPMYSSKQSWIETDFEAAEEGTMEPDTDEWGNRPFATALTIPLFPGLGKLVFLADASMLINRYTSQTDEFDNLLLFRNIINMVTSHQAANATEPIPVLFDFGHTYQGLTSPALYSTALMKLLAELSMFPVYAPFLPFFAYGYGKRLMPESRRLRPILLTKRRREKGHSDFEKKLELIKQTGTYGEPINHLVRKLVRVVQKDVRFTGQFAKDPKEMASFFDENYSQHIGSRRELTSQLSQAFKIASNPTRRISQVAAKKYLSLLKKLIDLLDQ